MSTVILAILPISFLHLVQHSGEVRKTLQIVRGQLLADAMRTQRFQRRAARQHQQRLEAGRIAKTHVLLEHIADEQHASWLLQLIPVHQDVAQGASGLADHRGRTADSLLDQLVERTGADDARRADRQHHVGGADEEQTVGALLQVQLGANQLGGGQIEVGVEGDGANRFVVLDDAPQRWELLVDHFVGLWDLIQIDQSKSYVNICSDINIFEVRSHLNCNVTVQDNSTKKKLHLHHYIIKVK